MSSSPTLLWDPEGLWLALQPLAPRGLAAHGLPEGFHVEVVPQIGSTNTALMDRIRAGDPLPGLLVAEQQTAGRGRLGRAWSSSAGASLTFSLAWPLLPQRGGAVLPPGAFTPGTAVVDWSALSLAVGLAVAQALDVEASSLGLKWPNDLWLRYSDDKLGGILIESLTVPAPMQPEHAHAADQPALLPALLRVAVVGIGLNIAAEPPAGGEYRTGYAGLHSLDARWDAPAVLHRVVPAVLRALAAYAEHGFTAADHAAYASRDVLAGRFCQAGEAHGMIEGIAPDGSLLMHTAAGTQNISSGEVSVRPW